MVLKGFIYTIAADIYAFRLAISTNSPCILHQNTLRFGAYCTIFSSKWPLKQCKWQFLQINIHFVNVHLLPPFASKQTFARIDFLRQGGRLVDKKGTHNVKFLAEKLTRGGKLMGWQVNKKTSGLVNELIVLFSPWQCSSKLDVVHLA